MLRVALIGLALVSCLMGCECQAKVSPEGKPNNTDVIIAEVSSWQEVDVDSFIISLPSGWKHEKGHGIDSAFGHFKGDGVVMQYSLGMHSLKLGSIDGASIEHLKISGKEAKIVLGGADRLASVHFPEAVIFKEENGEPFATFKLSIYGKDLTEDQQKLAVQIFKTIKFKE